MYWLGHPKKPTNCFNVSQGKTTKYATCWSRTTWHQENSKLARVQGERHSTPSKNVEWHRWYSIPQTQSHLTWGDANEKDGGLLFQKIVVSYLGYACPYYIFCILVYLSRSLSNNCRNVPPIHHAFVEALVSVVTAWVLKCQAVGLIFLDLHTTATPSNFSLASVFVSMQ